MHYAQETTAAALASGALAAAPQPGFATGLALPFLKDFMFDLTIYGFIAFGAFVIVGAGNAVNFTDGLDGLAIGPVMIAGATFGFIAYATGTPRFADYLLLTPTPGTAELAVVMGALVGGGLGFLWYNAPPAKVFMGDTGSLALGGCLGAMAVCVKHEMVLAIVGGLFLFEALSVIIQVLYFKATGKRFFKMAPVHHHFEKLGWSEPTVVIRFWIIAFLLALAGQCSGRHAEPADGGGAAAHHASGNHLPRATGRPVPAAARVGAARRAALAVGHQLLPRPIRSRRSRRCRLGPAVHQHLHPAGLPGLTHLATFPSLPGADSP